MAELPSTGYAWIRGLIKSSTVYLALYDETDTQIGSRIACSGADWSENDQVLTITKELDGTNFTLPQTIKGSQVYDAATGGNAITSLEAFADGEVTMRADADTLVVYHEIQVPQVV